MRIFAALILAAAAATPAAAQEFSTGTVDETPRARGLEEAAARYFAPPPTEDAVSVLPEGGVQDSSTVSIAIALGKVERALDACRVLRRDMQALIGDRPGGYSVNAGWLKRYQSCLLERAAETKALRRAISARQKELIEQMGRGEEEGERALKAADLMSRLAVRQSDVALAVKREAELQKAFVRYYNTGEMPDALARERSGPEPAESRSVMPEEGEAPSDMQYGPVERIDESGDDGDAPMAGPEEDAGEEPADPFPALTPGDEDATGGPMPLRRGGADGNEGGGR